MRPWTVVAVLALFGQYGCLAALHDNSADDEANDQVATVDANAEWNTILPRCSKVFEQTHKTCGLITPGLMTLASRERFAREVCGESLKGASAACASRFRDMLAARLEERYYEADFQGVAQHCRAYPSECGSLSALERLLLVSHDERLRANAREQEAAINARRNQENAEESAEHRAAISLAFQQIAQSLQQHQPPTVTTTHCDSDFLGGMDCTSTAQ